ncbi:MAG: energy-coupling factor transporter transmembrane component T [Candidatus Aminicenantes bacterium]|nr:energy-coupling factor transporter transmembrane component T [Candidatus Aminicenantes bacterium]
MRTSWHEIWGSGRGPAARLAPQTRILAGAAFFAACLMSPALSAPGTVFITATTAVWIYASGLPGRALRSSALLGLAMFLPYFLLVPLMVKGPSVTGPGTGWAGALAVPWGILLHGLAGLLIATATIATLTASDLRGGLLALPFPRVLAAILVQIVHQTFVLLSETNRVAAAMAVRGGSGRWRAAVRMLSSLPRVWLPRILGRADRVAAAMEIRGFAEADLRIFGQRVIRAPDAVVIVLAGAVLAVAATLRLRLL